MAPAITLLDYGSEWSGTTVSVSFSAPDSGDEIWLFVDDAGNCVTGTPSGYTLVDTINVSTNIRSRFYKKTSDGTETGVSLAKNASDEAHLTAFRVAAGEVDVYDTDTGTGSSVTLPSLTTTDDDTTVFGRFMQMGGTSWYSSAFGTQLQRISGQSWTNGWSGYETGPDPAGSTGTNNISFSTSYSFTAWHIAAKPVISGTAHTVTVTDDVGITDSRTVTEAAAHEVTVTDDVGITDPDAGSIERDLLVGDDVGLVDEVTTDLGSGHEVTITDDVDLVDDVTIDHAVAHEVTVTDDVDLVDDVTIDHAVAHELTITDTVGVADNTTSTVVAATWFFSPPTRTTYPRFGPEVGERYGHAAVRLGEQISVERGLTVVDNDGVFTEHERPNPALLAAADRYWRGGYRHPIDEDTYAELVAAGYSDNITSEVV